MNRPSVLQVGGTLYWVILTRDPDTMVLKDADSTPTVAVRKNGASTADSVTVTKRSATTGIYDCSYNPASEVEGDKFTFEESATVTGTTTSSATYRNNWDVTVIGGGSTVIVSPLSALAPERVNGTTISVAVGDLTPVTIDVYDANDAAVNLSTQGNLEVCIESRGNVDLQVVAHANITISGTDSNKATWTPNAAAVGTVDKHRWSLRTASAKKVLAYGPWVVERVALSDV